MIVFDLTNEESFKKAQSWVKELQRMGNPNMIMSLAGNKADLADQRAVSSEDAKVTFSGFLSSLRLHLIRLGQHSWSSKTDRSMPSHCVPREIILQVPTVLCRTHSATLG